MLFNYELSINCDKLFYKLSSLDVEDSSKRQVKPIWCSIKDNYHYTYIFF